MRFIIYICLFVSSSLLAQKNLDAFLPSDHEDIEKEFLNNFRNFEDIAPSFEKLYYSGNWVFPIYYDTVGNVCKSICYYNGKEFHLVGKQITTNEKTYYFGVLTQNDTIINTARWQESNTPYLPTEYKYVAIDFFTPSAHADYAMHITHKSDSICLTSDELRIFSEKRENVRKKIRSYYNENPPNPNPFYSSSTEYYYAGDTSAIYWIEVGRNLWGELLIGTDRYDLTGEIIGKELIFNIYNEWGQSVGVINLTEINSKNKTLIFKNNCFTRINERIYKKEISSISDKFGDVYLPSQRYGVGGSAGGEGGSFGNDDGN